MEALFTEWVGIDYRVSGVSRRITPRSRCMAAKRRGSDDAAQPGLRPNRETVEKGSQGPMRAIPDVSYGVLI